MADLVEQTSKLLEQMSPDALRQLAARITLLLGSSDDPQANLTDEEERVYAIICDAMRKRGIEIPAFEGRSSAMLKRLRLVKDLREVVTICQPIAAYHSNGSAIGRMAVYMIVVDLALDSLDAKLWHRNLKAKIESWLLLLNQGMVDEVRGSMANALEFWAGRAQWGIKDMLTALKMAPSLLEAAFPGYPASVLAGVIQAKIREA